MGITLGLSAAALLILLIGALIGHRLGRRSPKDVDPELLSPPLPTGVIEAMEKLRQADVVQISSLPVISAGGESRLLETPEGVAVITQTCDLVRSDKPNAQLSPVVRRPGDAKAIRAGRQPRFVHIPRLGEDAFIDLSVVATVDKELLVGMECRPGVDFANDEQVRDFGKAVGRRFSRFAFPDEVVLWLQPLKDVVQSRALKPSSPLGKILGDVEELRLEAIGGWNGEPPPYHLVLIIVMKPGTIPPADEIPVLLTNLPLGSSVNDIATMLGSESDLSKRYSLWNAFADALAALCKPKDSESAEVKLAVSSLTAELVSEDDLTYDRVSRSEELDLDHLSSPKPR